MIIETRVQTCFVIIKSNANKSWVNSDTSTLQTGQTSDFLIFQNFIPTGEISTFVEQIEDENMLLCESSKISSHDDTSAAI